jgi:hypothetical protein
VVEIVKGPIGIVQMGPHGFGVVKRRAVSRPYPILQLLEGLKEFPGVFRDKGFVFIILSADGKTIVDAPAESAQVSAGAFRAGDSLRHVDLNRCQKANGKICIMHNPR